jgi:hypothetical protein
VVVATGRAPRALRDPKGVCRATRVAILYTGQPNANAVRPLELERFLSARGHEVHLVDLETFPYRRWLRVKEPFQVALRRAGLGGPEELLRPMREWADIIQGRVLDGQGFEAVICESFPHALVLTRDLGAVTILDCPTPYVCELAFSGEHPETTIERLREVERRIYEACDHVAFHWRTYVDWVREHVYDGPNLAVLDWGCHPAQRRARFAAPPRTVYLGFLGGYWIDIGLLSRLARSGATHVDVWGSPEPEHRWGLDYRGFAPATDVLADYQLGLVTCSRDPLRRAGFSAKHLEYISHGLPVLAPRWRERLDLIRGTVAYDEEDFPEVVAALADEREWRLASEAAYRQAEELDWDVTLRPLEAMLR